MFKEIRLKDPRVVLSSINMSESRPVNPVLSLKNSTVRAPQSTNVALVIRLSIFHI